LVDSSNQKGDTEGSCHRLSLTAFVSFSEVHGDIADSLGDQFGLKWLIVVECMVLSLNSCVIDQHSSIADNAAHSASTVSIDLYELFRLGHFHELGETLLLNTENDSLRRSKSN